MGSENQVALVTGGSRGIGRAISEILAEAGYEIILTYVSRPEEAEVSVEKITQRGGKATAFALNVSDERAVNDFFANEIKDRRNLHILINNAGIVKDGPLLRMKEDAFRRIIDVNLCGAFFCMREAAKIMVRRRAGRIINIASVVGQMGNFGQANYSAAKAGLIGLTKTCAKELASRNITVNAVAPGLIETDMTTTLSEELRAVYLEQIPLNRFGLAKEVAEAVAFLASERASYITGQVIGVNGGLYM